MAGSLLLLISLLFITDSLSAAGTSEDAGSGPSNTETVRAAVGETAVLKCHLPNTGAFDDVYWELHYRGVLTHKKLFGMSLGRIEASCSRHGDDCLLTISNVRKDDSGLYHCGVNNTEPPIQRSVYLSVYDSLSVVDDSSEEATTENEVTASSGGPPSVVTAVVGSTASLTCKAPTFSKSVVGWKRKKKSHILTIGRNILTVDRRFHFVNEFPSDGNVLLIDSVKMEDSDVYECFDFGTRTNVHVVHLTVVEPTTKIVGEISRSVMEGDSVNLTCVIEPSPASEVTIEWTLDDGDEIIRLPNSRRMTTVTERGHSVSSTLLINDIRVTEAGNYTCKPSVGNGVATVTVHVARGQSVDGTDAADSSTVKHPGSTLEVTIEGANRSEENRRLDEYETGETRGLTLIEVQRLLALKELRLLAEKKEAMKLRMELMQLQKEHLIWLQEERQKRREN